MTDKRLPVDAKFAWGSLPTANQYLSHRRTLVADWSLGSKELSFKLALPTQKHLFHSFRLKVINTCLG